MRNKKAVLSKSARQGSVPPWPSNTGWRLQLCPCPCPLLAGGEGAACSSDSIRASKMDGFSGGIPPYSFLTVPWIHSNYLISSGLYTWVQVELLLLTTGLLLLSSSQIFLKASSSWEVGRQRGLSRGFSFFLSSSCNIVPWLRVTKPSRKHRLCACLQEASGSTWFLSRRIRIPKCRATSLLLSLLFRPVLNIS